MQCDWRQYKDMRYLACGLAVLMLIAGGCAPRYHDYSAFVHEHRPLVTASEYRLAPPDTILIVSKTVREINNHRETIRPDGKLTLPLLGSVYVAGMTPEQVSAQLQEMASHYYEDADVSVRVTNYASKKIFVFGEVMVPGPYNYDGANTVLEMLAASQPSRLADPSRIQILRPSDDGELRKRMTINLNRMVKEGDTTLDAVLEEGDIIYVPPSALASVGLAIQQLLLPISPAASTVQGTSQIESTTVGTTYGRSDN